MVEFFMVMAMLVSMSSAAKIDAKNAYEQGKKDGSK